MNAEQLDAGAAGTVSLGGLTVNRMGYGAMRITGPGIWGPPKDRANALAVLRHVPELDINFIDTADSYGPNVSEELIAEALYPYAEGFVIGTKGGLTRSGPNQWAPDCRPERLRKCVEGSLQRLRLDRIDLYQLHRPDPKVPWSDQVGVLAEMQREGKIRHVGLCNVDVEHLEGARGIVEIVSVQNRYNVRDRESEPVLEYCEQERIAFLPWFPLNAGDIHQIGTEVALAWLLHRSPIMLPIPGTQSIEHLEENVAAAAIRLAPERYAELDALAGKGKSAPA